MLDSLISFYPQGMGGGIVQEAVSMDVTTLNICGMKLSQSLACFKKLFLYFHGCLETEHFCRLANGFYLQNRDKLPWRHFVSHYVQGVLITTSASRMNI